MCRETIEINCMTNKSCCVNTSHIRVVYAVEFKLKGCGLRVVGTIVAALPSTFGIEIIIHK